MSKAIKGISQMKQQMAHRHENMVNFISNHAKAKRGTQLNTFFYLVFGKQLKL